MAADAPPAASRAQALYWRELVELKVDCEYARRYRDSLNRTLNRLAATRGLVSTAALGAWVTTNVTPRLWAAVIVLAQVAEAMQRAFPLAARFAGTNDVCAAYDALLIDALRSWADIAAGRVDDQGITDRLHQLMTSRHQASRKALPHGLPPRPRLQRLARADAESYIADILPHMGAANDGQHRA